MMSISTSGEIVFKDVAKMLIEVVYNNSNISWCKLIFSAPVVPVCVLELRPSLESKDSVFTLSPFTVRHIDVTTLWITLVVKVS